MLRTALRLACAVSLFAGAFAPPAAAQPADKRTLFTFSVPVAMPGVTLPAGQYLFRLANPDSGRNVVQVLSADGSQPYGMFYSLRAQRIEPAETPEVRFMETAAGMPAAIRTWWYPGERSGYEFIYPKEQARKLAQGTTSDPVLTTQSNTTTTEQTNTPDLARVSSTGQETEVTATAAATPGGAAQEGTIASAAISIPNATIPPAPPAALAAGTGSATSAATTAPASPSAAAAERTRLPQTASPIPLIGLLGTIGVLGALGLSLRRHSRVR